MKVKVKTEEVQLNAFSLMKSGIRLPTFSKGKIKTVRNKWGCTIAKYLIFIEEIEVTYKLYRPSEDIERGLESRIIYKQSYIRLKL